MFKGSTLMILAFLPYKCEDSENLARDFHFFLKNATRNPQLAVDSGFEKAEKIFMLSSRSSTLVEESRKHIRDFGSKDQSVGLEASRMFRSCREYPVLRG
jgi:hypothetical protein